ncbi:MAG: ABC transporter permease subunit [Mariprofundaceae bacterium]
MMSPLPISSRRNLTAKTVVSLLALPALLLPMACLIFILVQGVAAWDWGMLIGSGSHVSFGAVEALWPQIAGSLLLMLGACGIAIPFALGISLFHALRATDKQQSLMLGLLHVLQGIPPIVYGLCGLIVLVHMLHWGISVLTGSVILAVIILPLLVLSTVHAIERVATEKTDAAHSLGLPDAHIIWHVWLPEAWPAMLTGLLLGMARALSETAPILFTATIFSGVIWPDSIFSPVTSLQTHIFYLAQEGANPQAQDVAWASAMILVALVTLFGMTASVLRLRNMVERNR